MVDGRVTEDSDNLRVAKSITMSVVKKQESRTIAGMTPLLFHPNFGVFPLDQIAHVGVSPCRNLTGM